MNFTLGDFDDLAGQAVAVFEACAAERVPLLGSPQHGGGIWPHGGPGFAR